MTLDHDTDPLLRSVSHLQVLTPDEGRAERLRARCRARLAQRAPANNPRFVPALITGLCLVYLSAIVHDVLRLRAGF